MSVNNRIVERHAATSGSNAYCWTSYDFGTEVGQGNIFAHPLDFVPDGGEDICSLPNGSQVYWLGTAEGARLVKGPTSIVQDPNQDDNAVVNGLSCMTCHYAGMLFKADEVGPHVAANPSDYSPADREIIEAIYRPADLQDALEADGDRFLAAMDQTQGVRVQEQGIQPGDQGYVPGEPTFNLFRTFRDDMPLARVSAEVGIEPEVLKDAIDDLPPDLESALTGLESDGGNINRTTFLPLSQDLIAWLETGESFQPEDNACGGTGIACLEGQTCVLDEQDDEYGACVED